VTNCHLIMTPASDRALDEQVFYADTGNVVLDMARIVGPDGSVTGVDFDPQIVELASEDARNAGAENVEFHVADARVFGGGPSRCATAWPPIRRPARSSAACTRSPRPPRR
jgi:predicted RNA methylase